MSDQGPTGSGPTGSGPTGSGWTGSGPTEPTDPSAPAWGAVDVLGTPAKQSRTSKTWLVVAAVVVAVALVVGGAAYAVQMLSGGGRQPESLVPADAIAFVKIDLDPPAGQKVAALRFLRKLPGVHLDAGDDLRKGLVEKLLEDEDLAGLTYAEDFEPWLGQRVGIAALPAERHGAEPEPLGVLQVSDEDEARDAIRRIVAKVGTGEGPPGILVRDGYALIGTDAHTVERASTNADRGALEDSATFRDDMDKLGDRGVASGWVDLGAVGDAIRGSLTTGLGPAVALGYSGRFSFNARFDASYAEVVGRLTGSSQIPASAVNAGPTLLDALPRTTVAAVGVAGADAYVEQGWRQLGSLLGTLSSPPEGIRLPEDLETLVGSNLVAALDSEGLSDLQPRVGMRTVTDPDAAAEVVTRVRRFVRKEFGQDLPAVLRKTGDGIVLATDPAYADKLSADPGSTTLGDDPAFPLALPDFDQAGFAVWVDVDTLAGLAPDESDAVKAARAIDGVGLTATIEGTGSATYRLRVVAR